MKDAAIKVGTRIKYFRNLKELSQEKLALEAGLNPAFLGHLERGLKSPTIDTLAKISNALNVTLAELVDFDNSITNENFVIDKIMLSLKSLSKEDSERIAHIVCEITKLNFNK